MALKLMIVIIAIAAAAVILPSVATAKQYMVGDDKGWGPKVNYTEWAAGKEFFVGDSLVFMYTVGSHNVYKLSSGPDFQACKVPKGEPPLTTGNDVVTIAKPGKKWYICGVSGHCEAGQKLVINVQNSSEAPPSSPSPSPSPSSSPSPSPSPSPLPLPPTTSAGTTISPYSAIFIAVAVIMRIFV